MRSSLAWIVVLAAFAGASACASPRALPPDRDVPLAPSSAISEGQSAPSSAAVATSPPPAPAAPAPSSVPSAPASAVPAPVCTTKVVAPPFGKQPRCDRDAQCTLISTVCCFCGDIPRSQLRAAHVDGRLSACNVGTTCPACAASPPEPITGACVDHVCRGVEKVCK